MEGDEQKTVKPTASQAAQQQQDTDAQPDASKLRRMSMSQDNNAKLAQEQFKSVLCLLTVFHCVSEKTDQNV